jgi:tetratricopeptide (TPR) repeat protein
LVEEKDILQYVYTLYEKHLPHKAAVVLQRAIEQRDVAENRKNYELLSTMYQEARERNKAIEALTRAADFSTDGKNELSIAQLCFEMQNAQEAVIEYAGRAITKGVKQTGNAHMLMAVAYSELGRMEDAKAHLVKASLYKETHKSSSQWLNSLSEADHTNTTPVKDSY